MENISNDIYDDILYIVLDEALQNYNESDNNGILDTRKMFNDFLDNNDVEESKESSLEKWFDELTWNAILINKQKLTINCKINKDCQYSVEINNENKFTLKTIIKHLSLLMYCAHNIDYNIDITDVYISKEDDNSCLIIVECN